MQLTTALRASIMALAFGAAAAAPSPEAKKDCVVNSRDAADWVEFGLHRHRTEFSATGTDPSQYCKYWIDDRFGCNFQLNTQCGWSDEINSWHVDASFALGPAGDTAYRGCLDHTRNHWIKDTGCRTG